MWPEQVVCERLSGGRDGSPGPVLPERLRGLLLEGQADHQLDLHGLSPAEIDAWSETQTALAGATLDRLVLPDHCEAALVRRWIEACPKLTELTANHLQEDEQTLHVQHLHSLRRFHCEPPGPHALILPAKAEMVVPTWLVTAPRLSLLDGWVGGSAPLPGLSDASWDAVRNLLMPLIEEPASRHRQGFVIGQQLREIMVRLMEAAPQELLSGPAADNHRAVLARLQRGTGRWEMHYGEFKNFLRPVLTACWEALTRFRHTPAGTAICERKPADDLRALATLRRWVLQATPDESVGWRQRIAEAKHFQARRSGGFAPGEWHREIPPADVLLSPALSDISSGTSEGSSSPIKLLHWPLYHRGKSSTTAHQRDAASSPGPHPGAIQEDGTG